MDRTAELLRRVGAHANDAVRFALDGIDDDAFAYTPDPGVPTVGWRVCHIAAVLRLYVAHGFGAGGSSFVEYADGLARRSPAEALHVLVQAQADFTEILNRLSDDTLDELRPTHWGAHLPTWQLVCTIVSEQLHHGAEIGALLDVRRGAPRADYFPELQDGRTLS